MRSLMCAGVLAFALVAVGAPAQERPKPRTHTVTIADMRFTPETVTVNRGDTIVWINKDLVPHTVTSSRALFDSKTIAAGGTWRQAWTGAGSYDYICAFHPTMKGVVRVR